MQQRRRDGASGRAWLWVGQSHDAVWFHIDPRCSLQAALKVFEGAEAGAVLLSDRYSSYVALADRLGLAPAFCWAYVAHTIMLRRGGFVPRETMNFHMLRNIISCIHSAPRKAMIPLFCFHGRSGPDCAASQSAIALAFISISISA